MKPTTVLYLLFLAACSPKSDSDKRDDRFDVYPPLSDLRDEILVSSGQSYPAVDFIRGGFEFTAGLNKNDTAYLATHDPRFKIEEGFSVGDLYLSLPDSVKNNLIREPGWAYYYNFPSGWSIGFCEGSSCTDKPPDDSSKVLWIFQRK